MMLSWRCNTNNLCFSFCLIGSILIVASCLVVYLVLDHLAECAGQFYAVWPLAATVVCGIVICVLWVDLVGPLFNPVCLNGHENDMNAEYCVVCGVDLVPSCACGHVWNFEDFCPDCGAAHIE